MEGEDAAEFARLLTCVNKMQLGTTALVRKESNQSMHSINDIYNPTFWRF